MGVYGFTYDQPRPADAQKQQIGFSIFQIFVDGLVPVQVTDKRGRGLLGCTVIAENPTSEEPFSAITDGNGGVQMQLDAITTITATKDMVSATISHNGEGQHIIEVDILMIE